MMNATHGEMSKAKAGRSPDQVWNIIRSFQRAAPLQTAGMRSLQVFFVPYRAQLGDAIGSPASSWHSVQAMCC
jgi:hypothetical protein